jgi:hypothetical protein
MIDEKTFFLLASILSLAMANSRFERPSRIVEIKHGRIQVNNFFN